MDPICEYNIYLLIRFSLLSQTCQKFYLFEPICTAILLAAASGQLILISTIPLWRFLPPIAVHVIRIHAIHDKNRTILFGMSALFAIQVVVTAISCAFYRCTPRFSARIIYLFIYFSCPPPWRPGMYRRSSTYLGGHLLDSSHSSLCCFS